MLRFSWEVRTKFTSSARMTLDTASTLIPKREIARLIERYIRRNCSTAVFTGGGININMFFFLSSVIFALPPWSHAYSKDTGYLIFEAVKKMEKPSTSFKLSVGCMFPSSFKMQRLVRFKRRHGRTMNLPCSASVNGVINCL